MKVTGIIVEYNPFHNGHIYHINQARSITGCDVLVAVCSGNFVQRGQPAVTDKWERAKTAVANGVDLVIELPFPFVLQSATYFGSNAVRLLAMAGVDSIVFGSETNNLAELKEISEMSFNIDNFKENMKAGYSYPASYGFMADSYGPNDILAISYLRALQNYPDITPYSIKRTNEYDNPELTGSISSAMAIRKALGEGEDISAYTIMADTLRDYPEVTMEKLYPYIRTLLLTTPLSQLREIFLMDEGIENHLVKQANNCPDYASFISSATTKRYTASRIQRTLCHLMVQNTRSFMNNLPVYDHLRPLAYNQTGQAYLKQLQEKGVRIVNHFSQIIKPYRELEYKAAVVYSMLMNGEQQEKVIRGEVCGPYDIKRRP
ncbi:MAG: nucleotidyltransferase family protein [Erysipelotrichaceae bacterium]|nr:nucleotidyltransferase family protein [Erysipelotrichaceae bacterium]